MSTAAGTSRLETLTEWLDASAAARERALDQSLDRIRAMDPSLQAWVRVAPQRPTGRGPLSGIPVGIKDIIDTDGLPTEYGSPLYAGRRGAGDAAIVGELRRRGAIVLGKTQTTAFAYRTAAPTRNPRSPAHTPGGSSSGSAAAVAAGMVPVAVGTQTLGSVLRPASFCGVTGFKASYGLLPMDGVLPCAKSLDTLGFFTHSADDMLALWDALGQPAGEVEAVPLGAPDPVPEVEPEMAAAFGATLDRLRAAGAAIRSVDLAGLLDTLFQASLTIMFYEGARYHEQRFHEYGSQLADLANLVREGLEIPVERYDEARRRVEACRAQIVELFRATPVMLVPAATGPAPAGLAFTGDARMNAPWTALGTPAISIPMPAATALPLGLQLTADRGQDARVIRAAVRVQRLLGGGV